MNPLELQVHRQNTKWFIDQDPALLVLLNTPKKRDSSGGIVKASEPVPRDPEVFRLIPQGSAVADVTLTSGQMARVTHVILGEWDSPMERDDEFDYLGTRYKIVGPVYPEHTENAYERKAEVARLG